MSVHEMTLPRFLREAVAQLPPGERETLEELRLREGWPLAGVWSGEERVPAPWRGKTVTDEDLRRTLETAGQGSVHAILDQLRSGFVTAPGGLRIGVCGEGAVEEGRLKSFRRVTSLAIRFPHAIRGIARPLVPQIMDGDWVQSTLILSPPGLGKTTLLRDLIRCLSEGDGLPRPLRVGVADERGELGAGALRRDLGPRADVLENCPKAAALTMLLRGMAPQILAADEITAPEDLRAIREAAGCGVALLATAHGGSFGELRFRPLYRDLLAEGIFRRFVFIALDRGRRVYTVTDGEGRG